MTTSPRNQSAFSAHPARAHARSYSGAVLLCCFASFFAGHSSNAAAGEIQQISFAPSLASATTVNGQPGWLVTVQGRLSEPTDGEARRQVMISGFARILGADAASALFRERAGYFVSNSIAGARVAVAFGDQVHALKKTNEGGCFSTEVKVNVTQVAQAADLTHDGIINFKSVPARHRREPVVGTALLLAEEGVTVITDIDDTIKVTGNTDRKIAAKNTFMAPFVAVDGMADLYRDWQKSNGTPLHFHVVSAGPWHFHEPLKAFFRRVNFPEFTWDMRCVDVTSPTALYDETIHPDPNRLYVFKVAAIRAFLNRFPRRHAVLVGDSGERDPETYATILKEFGARIDAVYIRNVSKEKQDARYRALFGPGGANGKLQVFDKPDELPRRLATAR
ncbi:MAG: phosphatase domain-containing protein [Betaproteobacteria bacterium]